MTLVLRDNSKKPKENIAVLPCVYCISSILKHEKQTVRNLKMAMLRVSDFIVQEQFLALALLYAFLVTQIKEGFGQFWTLGFLCRAPDFG